MGLLSDRHIKVYATLRYYDSTTWTYWFCNKTISLFEYRKWQPLLVMFLLLFLRNLQIMQLQIDSLIFWSGTTDTRCQHSKENNWEKPHEGASESVYCHWVLSLAHCSVWVGVNHENLILFYWIMFQQWSIFSILIKRIFPESGSVCMFQIDHIIWGYHVMMLILC